LSFLSVIPWLDFPHAPAELMSFPGKTGESMNPRILSVDGKKKD